MAEVYELELENSDLAEIARIIINTLKQNKLYKKNLVFRGFDKLLVDRVLEHGTDNFSSIRYANKEDFLGKGDSKVPYMSDPAQYACWYGAMAVYDGENLHNYNPDTFEFINADEENIKDSLVAIFKLKFLESSGTNFT